MSINEVIDRLQNLGSESGLTLHEGADDFLLLMVEKTYNITLPDDFKTFYRFSDGFETVEDIFNMIPLEEIISSKTQYNDDPFYIAEYMIYSDMWRLEINPNNCNDYEVTIQTIFGKVILTHSLAEFIERFLNGGVFEIGGLYAWADEIHAKIYGNTDPYIIKPLLWVFRECLKLGLMTKQQVVDRADWIIATEDDPDFFFIEMTLSHDLNGLLTVLNSMNLTDDVMQIRAFFGVIYTKLLIDSLTPDRAISILKSYSNNEQFTAYERNKMMELIVQWDYVCDIWPGEKLQRQLNEDIKDFFHNYSRFNLYHSQNWERINMEVEQKFGNIKLPLKDEWPFKIAARKSPAKKRVIKGILLAGAILSLLCMQYYFYPPGLLTFTVVLFIISIQIIRSSSYRKA